MQKDFRSRRTGKALGKKEQWLKKRGSISSVKVSASFIFGLVVGLIAGGSAVGFYAGIFSLGDASKVFEEQSTSSTKPAVVFTFPTKLPADTVVADPAAYGETSGAVPLEYDLQVASFTSQKRAEELRANLILDSFQASTLAVSGSERIGYRVVVGPFLRRVEAERAMTALRGKGLNPILVSKSNKASSPAELVIPK